MHERPFSGEATDRSGPLRQHDGGLQSASTGPSLPTYLMTDVLPTFRYHPDPLATGAIKQSVTVCACCGQSRGYIYVGPVYGVNDLSESICPWCIADGQAAEKFDASFADAYPLSQANVPEAVIAEVHLRTPGYVSWQQENWLSHCGDACEFHGDASVGDVASASADTKAHWLAAYKQDEKTWAWATTGYRPGGDSALYKFVCRHCHLVLFGWDLS